MFFNYITERKASFVCIIHTRMHTVLNINSYRIYFRCGICTCLHAHTYMYVAWNQSLCTPNSLHLHVRAGRAGATLILVIWYKHLVGVVLSLYVELLHVCIVCPRCRTPFDVI